jgi:hypothetical protein
MPSRLRTFTALLREVAPARLFVFFSERSSSHNQHTDDIGDGWLSSARWSLPFFLPTFTFSSKGKWRLFMFSAGVPFIISMMPPAVVGYHRLSGALHFAELSGFVSGKVALDHVFDYSPAFPTVLAD